MPFLKKGDDKMSDDLNVKAGIDTTDFKSGVSQLTASVKSIEASFRASASVMDNWSGTSNGLKERVSSLSQILDAQKSKLQILHDEYDKVVASQGAGSKAAESLASKMFSTEKQITNTESSLSKYKAQLDEMNSPAKGLSDQLGGLTREISLAASQFSANVSSMGAWESKSSGIREKLQSLNDIAELQKQKIYALGDAYTQVSDKEGTSSRGAQELAIQLNNEKAALNNTNSDLQKYSEKLKNVEAEEKQNTSSLGKLKASFLGLANQSKESTSSISDHFSKLKSSILGAVAGIGISLGVTGLAKGIYSVAESASDLVESQNVVENTFKTSSKAIEDWTSTTAASAGIGKTAATSMVGAMGAMMKSSGITEKASGAMSEKLVQLTGDMSSFYNVSTNDMWEKIRSGISGETEPLKQLGINMSVANLQAFALAEGIKKPYKEMSQAEQTTLRYNYLLKVTADAQGDFARTSSTSMANQSRIFQMNIDSMRQTVGAAFLPMINNMFNSLNPLIQQAIPKLSEGAQKLAATIVSHKTEIIGTISQIATVSKDLFGFISQHGESVKAAIIGVATAFATFKTIGTVMTIFNTATKGLKDIQEASKLAKGAKIFENLFAVTPQVALIVGIIAAVAAAAYIIIKNWGPISDFFKNLWDGVVNWTVGAWNNIKSFFSGLWSWISNFFKQWGPLILTFIAPFIGLPLLIIQHWSQIEAGLTAIWNGLKSAMSSAWNEIKNIFTTVVNGIVTFVNDKFSWLINGTKAIFDGFKTYLGGVWELIKNIFLGPVLLILDLVTGNFSKLKDDAVHIFNNLKDAFVQIWDGIKLIFSGTLEIIKGYVMTVFNFIVDTSKNIWNGFTTFLSTIWNGIKNTASNAWNGLLTAIVNICNNIKTGAVNIFNEVLNFFRNLPGTLTTLGINAFNGLKNGISYVLSTLGSVITNGFSSAINWIKNLPSEALQWGKDIINGIVKGIKSAVGAVGDAIKGVAQDIRKFLHFSVPDEGPLADFDSWMPDMMNGLVNGITNNTGKLKAAAINAASVLSNGLKANVNIGANGASNGGSNSNVTNSTTSIQNSYGALLHVDNVTIANDMDIQTLANKLEFYRQQYATAKGA